MSDAEWSEPELDPALDEAVHALMSELEQRVDQIGLYLDRAKMVVTDHVELGVPVKRVGMVIEARLLIGDRAFSATATEPGMAALAQAVDEAAVDQEEAAIEDLLRRYGKADPDG